MMLRSLDFQAVSQNVHLIPCYVLIFLLSPSYIIQGGGEYDVQLGFGWTNGVVLDFLNTYGRRLTVKH